MMGERIELLQFAVQRDALFRVFLCLVFLCLSCLGTIGGRGILTAAEPPAFRDAGPGVKFHLAQDEMQITVDGDFFATYVWNDPKTTRPYFKHIHAHGGQVQLTRNHPPQEGDFDDHETFHPGVWWGFGDVGGNDYWRMKARIVGGQFVKKPVSDGNRGTFTVRNKLLEQGSGERFCFQICRYTIVKRPMGIMLICESTFERPESDFWLGDQEEMGLAFRVATPLTVSKGGRFVDSAGRTERNQLRTHQGDWCDYSGSIAGKFGGLMLMNDPENFRKPWWHAVETGLMVANPLGESELSGNGKRRENVLVKQGSSFRLRYGVLVHLHDNQESFQPSDAYTDFLTVLEAAQ